jgi:hypothetical protein
MLCEVTHPLSTADLCDVFPALPSPSGHDVVKLEENKNLIADLPAMGERARITGGGFCTGQQAQKKPRTSQDFSDG